MDINLNELLKILDEDVKSYLKDEKNGIFNKLCTKDRTTDYWLTWWSSITDIVTQLPFPSISCEQLVFVLKDYYHGKSAELRIVEEFERDYTPADAVHWYTRETFLYRLVNKALLQENIESLFLFGFYVRDLYSQIKQEHAQFKLRRASEPMITVYRGQIMSLNIIQKLDMSLKNESSDVSIESLCSTSLDRISALVLVQPSVNPFDEFHTVLFEWIVVRSLIYLI